MRGIRNARLVANGQVRPCDIALDGAAIDAICAPGTLGLDAYDARGLYLSHGFFDIHVHGGGDCDFMDATPAAWRGAAALHLKHGTTGMLPTTLAADAESLLRAFAVYRVVKPGFPDGAKFFGIHVEGPYISPVQAGAQDPAQIRNPDPAEYGRLLDACDGIRRWTVAPELPGALEMGDALARRGIVASIGHSNATYDEVCAALPHGYRLVTHLYSTMSTIVRKKGFRHAGVVESAYLLDALASEVIADGRHLPASLLRMAYRFIGPDRLCLVTDAMRAAGRTEGESVLGSLADGQRVILEDGVAKMPDREAFAGSICMADRLVRNMVRLAGAPLPDAVKMMTETPARVTGLADKTGVVAPGRAADLVLFDEEINVKMVMTDGIVRFEGGAEEA